jgi:hypothetical protein
VPADRPLTDAVASIEPLVVVRLNHGALSEAVNAAPLTVSDWLAGSAPPAVAEKLRLDGVTDSAGGPLQVTAVAMSPCSSAAPSARL